MEILGIGPSELVFIILIAIIILGPKDIQRTGRAIGRWLNRLVRSDSWKVFQKTSVEIRNLPRNLMREANLDEFQDVGKEIQDAGTDLQEIDKEIRQTIDPRPRPPASATSQNKPPLNQTEISSQTSVVNSNPSTESTVRAARDDMPVRDGRADQPPANQTDTSPQPPTPSTSSDPSTKPTVRAARDNMPVQDGRTDQPPSNQADSSPQPPDVNPTDVNGEMKQNG